VTSENLYGTHWLESPILLIILYLISCEYCK
jgi:hypothetical protein